MGGVVFIKRRRRINLVHSRLYLGGLPPLQRVALFGSYSVFQLEEDAGSLGDEALRRLARLDWEIEVHDEVFTLARTPDSSVFLHQIVDGALVPGGSALSGDQVQRS